MLNAALPVEAFNTSNDAPSMVPTAWREYLPRVYASNWHQLFVNENDGRRTLTWRNLFKSILDSNVKVYNFYSSSEDVLSHAPADEDASLSNNVWAYQEQHKGRWQQYVLPGRTACEGGWGKNMDPSLPYRTKDINAMRNEKLIVTPIFTPFEDHLHTTNDVGAISDIERNRILADGIPALSHAVGSTYLTFGSSWDMHQLLTSPTEDVKWPKDEEKWTHSDVRVFAYSFSYRVFEEIVNILDLKQ